MNPEVQAIYFGQRSGRRATEPVGRGDVQGEVMNEIWNPEYETMSREELRELQFKRLQMTLRWIYENVPFHHDRWSAMKLKPGDIRSLEDLRKLPFTVKSDFKAAYPYGLFALPLEKIIRIHSTSGTISNPTVVGYSRGDLNTWSELCARVAVAGGARSHDVAQISFEYGLTTGAFGMHAGLERVGVTVVPASTGNTQRQLQIMRDFKTTVLVGTPSYAMHMTEVAPRLGYDLKALDLGWRCWAPSRGPTRSGTSWRGARACRPATSTGSRRSSAPGSPTSAGTRTACTSTRTTSWSRWSTRRRESRCPTAKRASWSSRR